MSYKRCYGERLAAAEKDRDDFNAEHWCDQRTQDRESHPDSYPGCEHIREVVEVWWDIMGHIAGDNGEIWVADEVTLWEWARQDDGPDYVSQL